MIKHKWWGRAPWSPSSELLCSKASLLLFFFCMPASSAVHHRQRFQPLSVGLVSCIAHKHQHGRKRMDSDRRLSTSLLVSSPSCCPPLCPSETKRWGWRNGQPLIKFPLLFLSVPPMLFSYRFWALALCESQENKQAFELRPRILLFKCFFSSWCLNRSCLDESDRKSRSSMISENRGCFFYPWKCKS